MKTFTERCWAAYWAKNASLWLEYVRDRKNGDRSDPAFVKFEREDRQAYRQAMAEVMAHEPEGFDSGKKESEEEAQKAATRAEEKAREAVARISGEKAAFVPEGTVTVGSGHAESQRQQDREDHEAANQRLKAERPLYYACGHFARQVAHLSERAAREGYGPKTRKRLAKLKKLAFKLAREVDSDPQTEKLGI